MTIDTQQTVTLDGSSLTLDAVARVARFGAPVDVSPSAAEKVIAARWLVEKVAEQDAPAYGINTGFGTLAEVRIDKKDLKALQKNLILSHAAGVGAPLSIPEARAMLLLRCAVLAKGHSGARLNVLKLGLDMLNAHITPVVPERGSVGASGDLAPLAHLALTFIGEGEAFDKNGERMGSKQALAAAGLAPIELEAKEGLTLVNGTQAMCAVGTLTVTQAIELLDTFDVAGAMSLEAQLGTHTAFDPLIHDVRPHQGQRDVAAHLRALLKDSEIVKTHADCGKVQDAYSLRCMPQVHGAACEGLRFAQSMLTTEINSATDNPLVFANEERILSGGNFHGQPISLALDVVAMALTQLMAISERRIEQLVNPSLSGLPPFLAKNSGLHSGFMIAQVTAAALVAEARILCHPASVDSIPTSANREDHVSMGMTAALKARQVLDFAKSVASIELLCAAQGLEFRKPSKAGRGVQAVYEHIRAQVNPMFEDREVHKDIATIRKQLDSGALFQLQKKACIDTTS